MSRRKHSYRLIVNKALDLSVFESPRPYAFITSLVTPTPHARLSLQTWKRPPSDDGFWTDFPRFPDPADDFSPTALGTTPELGPHILVVA